MSISRMPAVKAATGHRSPTSVYNAIREGLFPKQVLIGSRAVGWPSEEVEAVTKAWIAGWSKAEIRNLVTDLHAKRLKAMS
jgi:prophage regulatory protein